jgi:lipoprotein-releasing system permease protein
MFELYIALKYLLPKRRTKSTSLVSLMSVFVISLVVWLVLVFLSVTVGIEKNWLEKLTSINAPLRISPTDAYYSSYYYQIDSLSSTSNYSYKTIGEKSISNKTDPYSPEIDMEIPTYWPKAKYKNTKLLDPVKKAFQILEEQKAQIPDLQYQDYEISGALLRIILSRQDSNTLREGKLSQLTQMSYLTTINENNPKLKSLILTPTIKDLNHLIYQIDKSSNAVQKDFVTSTSHVNNSLFKTRLKAFFDNIKINSILVDENWEMDISLLPNNATLDAYAFVYNDVITKFVIPTKETINEKKYPHLILGKLYVYDGALFFISNNNAVIPVDENVSINLETLSEFQADLLQESIDFAKNVEDIQFTIKGYLQTHLIHGQTIYKNIKINDATTTFSKKSLSPFWCYYTDKNKLTLPVKEEDGKAVLLPKSSQESGVLIGDKGFLSYASSTATSTQEQRIPIFVAGFYDPGILPVGNRCILVPSDVTRTINAANATFSPDGTPTNGIYVWFDNFSDAEKIKTKLQQAFTEAGISSYWKISTFKEYEFAKDLMEQFQSDRTLFTLIAIIILAVACSNIISLLVILVNDKKKEIAVLQALGASKKSIASVFGICGIVTGSISSLIGTLAAIFTLHNLDHLVNFLSFLQGHSAFNVAIFGKSLPNELSMEALLFIFIATPIISLIAGIIPAIKASKLCPSTTLRSE